MARAKKEFEEYITDVDFSHVTHQEYVESPATAFLKFTVEAKSAVDMCSRKFPKNQDGNYSKNSRDSLQHIIMSMLPAIMGHFETFQKNFFSGLFDLTVFLEDYDIENCLSKLSKNHTIDIDINRLAAYRDIGTSSVGIIVADNLNGWHDPHRVNKYFDAFNLDHQLFSNDDCKKLNVLWQLRHSIVHTGGTLTLPDSQKIKELNSFGEQSLAFENNFIFEVSRKLHPLIQRSVKGFEEKFNDKLLPNVTEETKNRLDKFFKVKSSIAVWL